VLWTAFSPALGFSVAALFMIAGTMTLIRLPSQ